jgi:hypothetical protein
VNLESRFSNSRYTESRKRSLFQNSRIGVTSDLGSRVSTSRYAESRKGSLFQNLGIGMTSDLGSRVVNSRYTKSQKDIDLAKGEILEFGES